MITISPISRGLFLVLLSALIPLTSNRSSRAEEEGVHWPHYRGSNASGISEGHPLPTEWNVEEKKNLRWKTEIPGLGLSAVSIWGDRIFVNTAIGEQPDKSSELRVGLYGDIAPVEDDSVHHFTVYALDKKTGKIIWEDRVHSGIPKIKRHTKASHANCAPATNGERVVNFFGSEGLYCHDMEGQLIWKKDLGVLDSGYYRVKEAQWGFASSPVIFKDMVLVQCDVQENSFVAAYSVTDGKEIWRTDRDEVPTWSTPTVHVGPDRTQVILNGYKHIGGYDVTTGKELWSLVGGGDIPVPTPVLGEDHVYITNAHGRMAPTYAIRLDAVGTVTDDGESEALEWVHTRGGAYMQTPLLYGDYLYSCQDHGVLTCFDAKTGDRVFRGRLGGGRMGFTASPVAGDGKIYFTSEDGDVYVIKASTEMEILATNPLGEVCMATPSISEGVLYFRTQKHLVAISTEGDEG